MAAARRGEDRVIGRVVRPALGAIAFDDLDIVAAQPLQPLPRDADQRMLALDTDDLRGNPADDRRRVT